MTKPLIGFCGLTHLGICSAVAAIAKGYKVVCYDSNIDVINSLKQGLLTIVEPDVAKVLENKKKLITFTNNITEITSCDIIYISLDIETSSTGKSDLAPISELTQKILDHLKSSKILIILSQVPPGFTRNLLAKNHKIYYQVETLIFGKALERALYPERIIIGSYNPNKSLPKKYLNFLNSFNCPIIHMKYESAELTKISINLFLLASLSTTNKMAEICENINADWHEIMPALRLDKRIGEHAYISPGLGVSGGNLERDLKTINMLSREKNIENALFIAFKDISDNRKNWVINKLDAILTDKIKKRIGILGLTYKENTHSLKNAVSLELIPLLENHDVVVYDPVVDVKNIFGWCSHAKSIQEVIYEADILIILTPWDQFKDLKLDLIREDMKGNIIIDPFKIFDQNEVRKNKLISYVIGS